MEHLDTLTAKSASDLEHRNQQTQPSTSNQDDRPHPQESPTRRPQKKMITEDEIVGQAFVFLLAGYETSSNTLAFTCYLLAINPECQRKVQEEVDDFFTRHVSVAFSCERLWIYLRTRQIQCMQTFYFIFMFKPLLNYAEFTLFSLFCRSHQIMQMSKS